MPQLTCPRCTKRHDAAEDAAGVTHAVCPDCRENISHPTKERAAARAAVSKRRRKKSPA